MSDITPNFVPHSDISLSDMDDVNKHNNLIKQNNYSAATTLAHECAATISQKGVQASFFNAIEQKIRELQIYLLNKTASPDEYYSLTEPSAEFMKENGYLFWLKPVE